MMVVFSRKGFNDKIPIGLGGSLLPKVKLNRNIKQPSTALMALFS